MRTRAVDTENPLDRSMKIKSASSHGTLLFLFTFFGGDGFDDRLKAVCKYSFQRLACIIGDSLWFAKHVGKDTMSCNSWERGWLKIAPQPKL